MLVLYETAAGYALFKLVNDSKLEKSEDIWKDFETAEKANAAYVPWSWHSPHQHHPLILRLLSLSSVKLKAFTKFENTTDALSAVTGLVEGKVPKNLKKFLETEISEKEMKKEKLIISDPKLGKWDWVVVVVVNACILMGLSIDLAK